MLGKRKKIKCKNSLTFVRDGSRARIAETTDRGEGGWEIAWRRRQQLDQLLQAKVRRLDDVEQQKGVI